MDLFHFTMQQLAPNPLRFWEGDPHTVRAYLHHWLRRYHYPHEPRRVLAGTFSLKMDALGWSKLLADTAEFYGLPLPSQRPAGLSTLADVEAYVQQQLRNLPRHRPPTAQSISSSITPGEQCLS